MFRFPHVCKFLVLPILLFATPANAADAPDAKSAETKLLMDATDKLTDVIKAQLDGDTAKLEKTAAEAISIYDQIIVMNPANFKAINTRGNLKDTVLKGSGDADFIKAIEITNAALSANANDANAYYGRAVAERGLKKFDEARADYKKAIELNPAIS